MLYTAKGDKGTTTVFGCDQRISKSSAITEALGSLDEINSFLGLAKIKANRPDLFLKLSSRKIISFVEIVEQIQEDLFIIQAEIAGADKHIAKDKIKYLEDIISVSEKELPPIKTFLIAGASEISALFDIARTIARRAERRVVTVAEEKIVKISPTTLIYLNRLSSLLYVGARLSAHKSGIKESTPRYK